MFGLRLPMNFDAPYRAASIREFWRRWHMTLSRFLRDYLYIPLGGNRHGPAAAGAERGRHHAAGRAVARRQLDVRRLGRAARRGAGGQRGLWHRAGLRMPWVVGWALTLLFVTGRPGCCSGRPHGPPRAMCCRAWPATAGFGSVQFPDGWMVVVASGLALLGPTSQALALGRWLRPTPWLAVPAGWRRWRCCCCPGDGCRMRSSTSSSDKPLSGHAGPAREWRRFLRILVATAAVAGAVVWLFIMGVDPYSTLPVSAPFFDRGPVDGNARYAFPVAGPQRRLRQRRFRHLDQPAAAAGGAEPGLRRPLRQPAMNSATSYEQTRLLEVFLRHHPAPRVIAIGLDVQWCLTAPMDQKITFRRFPAWLYDEVWPGRWRDYLHMFDMYSLEKAGQAFGQWTGLTPAHLWPRRLHALRAARRRSTTPPGRRPTLPACSPGTWPGT